MGHNRVIVIGSGVAGLACARELTQRGYKVLVVEARSRVGGRLKGEPLQVQPEVSSSENNQQDVSSSLWQDVDLGGALIHGIENNPMHKVTTQMGVPLHKISDYCLLLDENGWPFDPKEDEKLSALFNECLDLTFQRCSLEKHSTKNFGELFDQVCQEKGVALNNPLIKWHQANLELPTGADFHQLGYTWNDDEPYGFAGDHVAVERSWKAVMENLAEGLDVMFNSPVTRIQVISPDGSTPLGYAAPPTNQDAAPPEQVNGEGSTLPVKIITRTEWRNTAKLKITSPVRQSRRLKGEDINVRRSSRSNKGVIRHLQIGHAHGSLCYDDPFKTQMGRKRKRNEKGTDNHEEDSVPTSKVHVTLQSGTVLEADAVVCTLPLAILKIPPHQPGHVRFVPPLPDTKRRAIEELGCGLLNKCAMSFPSVFWQDSDFLGLAKQDHSYLVLNAMKYTGKPILIFMYGGTFAKQLESWTDTDIVDDCLGVLKKICGKDVPPPLDYCITRWGLEQYSRMAFTYIPPGVDGGQQLAEAGDAVHDPALPDKPLIMFAGEHTTPYHPSTMHGAFLSGIREAYRYDIFVCPKLNGNLQFDTDHKIYEYTFPTRRVYKETKTNKLPSKVMSASAASSQIRNRRSRFAGMALRKLPRKNVTEPIAPTSTASKVQGLTPDLAGSRRSQRSLAAKKLPDFEEETNDKSETERALQKKKHLDELEDRILLRSLDSYGREFTLIRTKIIPVYGSTRKRSAEQIRRRWQQIAGRKRRSDVWKQWEATKLAPETPRHENGVPSVPSIHCRRSNRTPKPNIPNDM